MSNKKNDTTKDLKPDLKQTVRVEYITNYTLTRKEMAEKHGIKASLLLRWITEDLWDKQRAEYRDMVDKKTKAEINKVISKNAKELSTIFETQLTIAETFKELLVKAAIDQNQFNRYLIPIEKQDGFDREKYTEEMVFNKIDMPSLLNATKVLVEITKFEKMLQGILTTPEELALKIEMKKLEIEDQKLKLALRDETAASNPNPPILILPAIDESLMTGAFIESEKVIVTPKMVEVEDNDK